MRLQKSRRSKVKIRKESVKIVKRVGLEAIDVNGLDLASNGKGADAS